MINFISLIRTSSSVPRTKTKAPEIPVKEEGDESTTEEDVTRRLRSKEAADPSEKILNRKRIG